MAKREIKTSIKKIAEYWSKNSKIPEEDLMFDWDIEYCSCHCWNCGDKRSTPQRAHIIPHILGGKDVTSNYVLLCGECHAEAPNVNCKDAMWDWIKHNKKFFGLEDTYKIQDALARFKEKNSYSFIKLSVEMRDVETLCNDLKEEYKKIGVHGSKITTSSLVYLFESLSKRYIKEKELSIEEEAKKNERRFS